MTAAALLLGLAAVVLAAAALVLLRRAAEAERVFRHDLLADCRILLDDPRPSVDAAGYGVLHGRCAGFDAALRSFAEALAFRRLPQLWLAATVRAETGTAGSIDVVRRPTGAEFYSAGGGLPRAFAPPPGWPQDTQIRGDRAAGEALAQLADLLAAPLADPRTKSVLVTPHGVRVVRQIAQGARGSYLLFRDTRFALRRAPASEAQAALDLAVAIAAALSCARSATETHDAVRAA